SGMAPHPRDAPIIDPRDVAARRPGTRGSERPALTAPAHGRAIEGMRWLGLAVGLVTLAGRRCLVFKSEVTARGWSISTVEILVAGRIRVPSPVAEARFHPPRGASYAFDASHCECTKPRPGSSLRWYVCAPNASRCACVRFCGRSALRNPSKYDRLAPSAGM